MDEIDRGKRTPLSELKATQPQKRMEEGRIVGTGPLSNKKTIAGNDKRAKMEKNNYGEEAPTPTRKSPRRKKPRTESQENDRNNINVSMEEDQDDDGGKSKCPLQKETATPPIDPVELNTRRNSLRPLQRQSISSDASSPGTSIAGDDNTTVTLEAFQQMLDAASDDDDDENEKEHDSDQSEERNGEKQKQSEKSNMHNGNKMPEESDEDDDEDKNDEYQYDSDDDAASTGRRNTASPSLLAKMLEDSDDDENDEELLAAQRRGQQLAEELSESADQLLQFQSPPQQQISSNATNKENDTPPIATRTRSSAKKSYATKSVSKKAFEPTPLKSCISARKKGIPSSRKKRSVVFGSPDAAEFEKDDPVKGGVTPLARNYARTRFKMEDPKSNESEDALIEEDGDTALNTSILATWEEESDEDESDQSSASIASNKGGRKNKSGSGRRASSIYSRGSRNPLEDQDGDEILNTSVEHEESLVTKFDKIASERATPPPSPHSAELALQEGKGVLLKPLSKPSLNESMTDEGEDEDMGGNSSVGNQTADLSDLLKMSESPPESKGRESIISSTSRSPPTSDQAEANQTVDFDDFNKAIEMMDEDDDDDDDDAKNKAFDHNSPKTKNQDDQEETTVELGSLSQLASFSPAAAGTSRSSLDADTEEQTVELGRLSELATLSAKNESSEKTTPPSFIGKRITRSSAKKLREQQQQQQLKKSMDPEEHTVELGKIGDLARFSIEHTGELKDVVSSSSEKTVELGTLSELVSFGSVSKTDNQEENRDVEMERAGQTNQPEHEEKTVELGSLQDLANFEATSSSGSKREQKVTTSLLETERTVELGSLKQLATLTPVVESALERSGYSEQEEENLSHDNLRSSEKKEEGEQSGFTDHEDGEEIQAQLHLSFSSSTTSGSEHGRKSSIETPAVLDSAAVLDQFLDSPVQTKPQNSDEQQQQIMEDEKERNLINETHAPGNDNASTPQSSVEKSKQQTPQMKENESPIPAREPHTPEAFLPRMTLARTPVGEKPIVSENDEIEAQDKEENVNVHESQNEIEPMERDMEDTVRVQETVKVATFLKEAANIDLKFELEQIPSTDEGNDSSKAVQQLCQENSNLSPTDVTFEKLNKACQITVETCGTKWEINELRSRMNAAERTIAEISKGLEKNQPSILTDIKNRSAVVHTLKILKEEAEYESQIALCDLRAKRTNLCLQAGSEHAQILKEDDEILERGIEQLDQALLAVDAELDALKKVSSLREALTEQQVVVDTYAEDLNGLEVSKSKLSGERDSLKLAICEKRENLAKEEERSKLITDMNKSELDFESENAVLEVLHGLHVWRLQNVSAQLVKLVLDLPSGSYNSISIAFDSRPCISSIVTKFHSVEDQYEDEDDEDDLQQQIEKITTVFILDRVTSLNKSVLGREPSMLPKMLRDLDLEFGRLQDLWDEIHEMNSISPVPCKINLLDDRTIQVSTELTHDDAGALLELTFSISRGYPIAKDSCKATFNLICEGGENDQLLSEINQSMDSIDNQTLTCFTPLSEKWNALSDIFGLE